MRKNIEGFGGGTEAQGPAWETGPIIDAPLEEKSTFEKMGERAKSWQSLRKLLFWGSVAVTPFSTIASYEHYKPIVDTERIELGGKPGFSLESKSGRRMDFTIEKQGDGTYKFQAITSGGPEIIQDGKHLDTTSSTYILPAGTDVKHLLERLKTAQAPQEVLRDVMADAISGDFIQFEKGANGGVTTNYELKFMPGKGKEGAHAIQTVTDEHGEKHVTHIAFKEAMDEAQHDAS